MKKLTKRVQVKGLWFDVPMFTSHIVINGNGYVLAMNIVAACNLNQDSNDWRFPITEGGEYTHIGQVDLEGANWRECCWYVGDQTDGEALERREWMARGAEGVLAHLERGTVSAGNFEGVCLSIKIGKSVLKEIRAGEIK